MNTVTNIFWNSEEERLRSGYRIVLIFIIYLLMNALFDLLVGFKHLMDANEPHLYILYTALAGFVSTFVSVWIAGRILVFNLARNGG